MTHDELLAKIDKEVGHCTCRDDYEVGLDPKDCIEEYYNPFFFALRSVVEIADKDIEHESLVWLSGYCFAMEQVVQAIEKELK